MSKRTLRQQIGYPLSDIDIEKCLPFEVNLYHYSALKNLDNLFDLLHPNNVCVIYFETGRTDDGARFGHWTALGIAPKSKSIKSKTDLPVSINYFNSYGTIPDDEKLNIDETYQQISNQSENILTQLLADAADSIDIEYNEEPLQKKGSEVNTCGRFCVVRLMLKDFPLDVVQKFLRLPGSTPDEKVCMITEPILNEGADPIKIQKNLIDLVISMR